MLLSILLANIPTISRISKTKYDENVPQANETDWVKILHVRCRLRRDAPADSKDFEYGIKLVRKGLNAFFV